MANSGVTVRDECVQAYRDMKMNQKYSYVLYGFTNDMKEVMVLERGAKHETYEDLVEHFRAAEENGQCRYALFDLDYRTPSGVKQTKILFFAWAPDAASVRQKMIYTSKKGAFKKALGKGFGKDIQANDQEDLNMEVIMQEIHKSDRH